MSIIKKPYEISLWEDVLVFVVERADGIRYEYEGSLPNNTQGQVIAQYYKERKICTIGSDTMDTPIRATQAKLNSKINGENILTFNMYSHYYDESGEYYSNPFIGLLINERKIKLRYGKLGDEDTKWYDLVIKNIQENSETKTYSYTAKDLFVNELSKSGFNLELNVDLENNMGNITKLATYILDESDWQLKGDNDFLKQTIEEPLYELTLNQSITAKNMETDEEIEISKGSIIYGFYTNIVNQDSYLQFLYAKSYETNDDYVITNSPNWYKDQTSYNSDGIPAYAVTMDISSKYRGARLVRKAKTKYDSTIDKYVTVYKDGNSEVYGYTETEYTSPAAVRSYITNPNSFDSYAGWSVGGVSSGSSVIFPELQVVSVPDIRDVTYSDIENNNQSFSSCLKLKFLNKNQVIYNSGAIDHRQYINGFAKGEKYVFRVKYGEQGEVGASGNAKTIQNTDINLTFSINKYSLSDGVYEIGDTYFSTSDAIKHGNSTTEYIYYIIECKKELSYKKMVEMSNSLGMFIKPSKTGTIYIEDVQFFPYIDNDGRPLLPDDIKTGDVKTLYLYYTPSVEYKSIEDVEFIYRDYKPSPAFTEAYNDKAYEKIRSITASESNRFNLLQELCEIFECWIKFEIEHNMETGEILLDDNYRQKKWVSFHEYIDKDNYNYSGFKYGINLKSIQRTIDSETIVSKMVVKNNSNEFATDGFCSIARAFESPNGENFLLDFSYYVQQGLLGIAEITNDLYLDINGYLGYYKYLKRINEKRDIYIQEQAGLLTDISEYQALVQTYTLSTAEAEEQLKNKKAYIQSYTGYTFEQLMNNQPSNSNADEKIAEWWDNDQVISAAASIARLKSVSANHSVLLKSAQGNLDEAQKRYDWLNRALTSRKVPSKEEVDEERLLIEKEHLHRQFYKKYSRFLQEGSWISEDYVDDDLYYLDAQSTLHTSCTPKITYNINVLELSRLEGYENYTFSLGDKTTIEDTEFFGWVWDNTTGIKSPYREEIVVTELTIMLDSPEQDQIKVQNYKTQFEDLFQRMAATTQSVEYSTGQYQKVAGIVETDGTIDIVTLQNSIANNALTLQNAKDQTVVWDETGITTASLSNPSEIVRIISGGIFLSTDGGITWNTGITGKGINANYITSGKINTEEVNILAGAFPSFRWDNSGISAYEFTINETTGAVQNFNYSKFVRLDQYGLYGINGLSNFNSAEKDEQGLVGEEKIWKHSNFALTWKGFQIKSSHVKGGYVSITSDNDFQVINSENKEQIKIGLLYDEVEVEYEDTDGTEKTKRIPLYGIRISDWAGQVVMEQASDGKMWIRDGISIGSGVSSTVSIGYIAGGKTFNGNKVDSKGYILDEQGMRTEERLAGNAYIHEVINANNKFIVYEDGSMKATEGYFEGEIHATGGTIGGLQIDSIVNPDFEVVIESDSGLVFKSNTEEKTLTAKLYKGQKEITSNDGILTYQWYRYSTELTDENSQTIIVKTSDLDSISDQATYQCAITYIPRSE